MRFSEAEQRVRDAQKQVNEMKLQRNQLKFEVERLAKGGPRTEQGKRIASMNAVKTALTGRTVLLPSDDADAYRGHLAAYQREYSPVGLRESELVQSLADTQWRLSRIPGLESAIYAKGRYEFAEAHAEEEITLRKALIELDTHLKYEKQLRNLQLQESRLHRRYEKESAELRQLQKDRTTSEAAVGRERTQPAPAGAAALSNSAAALNNNEFVFSTPAEAPQTTPSTTPLKPEIEGDTQRAA
ncbi:MAG TPA: hypothetical protein VHZ55_22590 [Bryobacteraceae bacterium]|nr:hypothetical protein [Bryobacteraceae bacterium]